MVKEKKKTAVMWVMCTTTLVNMKQQCVYFPWFKKNLHEYKLDLPSVKLKQICLQWQFNLFNYKAENTQIKLETCVCVCVCVCVSVCVCVNEHILLFWQNVLSTVLCEIFGLSLGFYSLLFLHIILFFWRKF